MPFARAGVGNLAVLVRLHPLSDGAGGLNRLRRPKADAAPRRPAPRGKLTHQDGDIPSARRRVAQPRTQRRPPGKPGRASSCIFAVFASVACAHPGRVRGVRFSTQRRRWAREAQPLQTGKPAARQRRGIRPWRPHPRGSWRRGAARAGGRPCRTASGAACPPRIRWGTRPGPAAPAPRTPRRPRRCRG